MFAKLMRLHRFLAITTALPLLLFIISGLLHPIMVHFFTPERKMLDIINSFQNGHDSNEISLINVLNIHNIPVFSSAKLVKLKNQSYYQIRIANDKYDDKKSNIDNDFPDMPSAKFIHKYFSTTTGLELKPGDCGSTELCYVKTLAKIIGQSDIIDSKLITQFTPAYGEINRILPVYRVRFSSGNIIYVDPQGDRIALSSNQWRERIATWFDFIHRQSFVGDKHNWLRLVFSFIFTFNIFLMGITGVALYLIYKSKIKKKNKHLTNRNININKSNYFKGLFFYSKTQIIKYHRSIGLVFSLSLIGFATSGLHTLISKFDKSHHFSISPSNEIDSYKLTFDPLKVMNNNKADNFNLVNWNNELWLQLWFYGNKNVLSLKYWHPLLGFKTDKDYAIYLAQKMLHLSEVPSDVIKKSHFDSSYSPIFKRLPVQQLHFANNTVVAIETHTQYIAQFSQTKDIWQGLHFSLLHKYHFLNGLGRQYRDLIISFVMFGFLLTTLMGSWLYFSRKKQFKKS